MNNFYTRKAAKKSSSSVNNLRRILLVFTVAFCLVLSINSISLADASASTTESNTPAESASTTESSTTEESTSTTQTTSSSKKKKKKATIVITSFHWGIEKDYYPNAREISLGHCAIENGASLVLGHHPHRLQGIEKYKGRYIVYSLGNFSFGGHSNPDDKDTMIFQQTFYVKNGKLLKKSDVKVIPCSISSVNYTNNFQPKVLTGSEKKRVIRKINTLSKGMNASFKLNGKAK